MVTARKKRAMLILLTSTKISGLLCFPVRQKYEKRSFCMYGTMKSGVSELGLTGQRLKSVPEKLLIHWRGEAEEGYSFSFRQPEFVGALSAVISKPFDDETPFHFENALKYDGAAYMSPVKLRGFDGSMQYIALNANDANTKEDFSLQAFISAVSRCSLIHSMYEVIAEGEQYDKLSTFAMENGGFKDMYVGEENENDTWAVRVRHFGDEAGSKKERRHGARTRSLTMEKEALIALKPLLLKFGGGVDLRDPDCKIYVMDGLGAEEKRKVLARKIASGRKVSLIAPSTRICVTTTPLEPIAAFSLCNIAGIREGQKIFDPFSGSCAILLAAAMIEPSCETVGVDIAHDVLVNRDDIRKDFATRGLNPPKAVFRGDSTYVLVRDQARAAVGGEPFDHIITDPPYGIREKMNANAPTPLEELFQAITDDREQGKPLLKRGGRLVAFVPCHPEDDIMKVLPRREKAEAAGMQLVLFREQPLNSKLSRWLVSYVCVR